MVKLPNYYGLYPLLIWQLYILNTQQLRAGVVYYFQIFFDCIVYCLRIFLTFAP